MQASLLPDDGGRPIRLEKDVTVVGRRRWVCDIYIDDRTISKFHCLVIKAPNGLLYIRDLGSANGTFVNGARITEEAILHGDEVMFATRRFRLRINDHADSAADSSVASGNSLGTLQVPDGSVVVDVTPLPDVVATSGKANGPRNTMKMTAEDEEKLGQWMRMANSADNDLYDTGELSVDEADSPPSDGND